MYAFQFFAEAIWQTGYLLGVFRVVAGPLAFLEVAIRAIEMAVFASHGWV